jgi:hypothetical protein
MKHFASLFTLTMLSISSVFAQSATDSKPSFIARPSSCSAAAAHRLLGEKWTPTSHSLALGLSGASSLRVLHSGGVRDLGLVAKRLTVKIDAQQRVTELTCE